MSWCKLCGRYHLYGACTGTVTNSAQAWDEWRKMLQELSKRPR